MDKWEDNYIKLKSFYIEERLKLVNEIKDLKRQLAYKDIEIEHYLKVMENDRLYHEHYVKGCQIVEERQKQHQEQSKIDFAVDFTLNQINNIKNILEICMVYNPINNDCKFDRPLYYSSIKSLVEEIKQLKQK